MSGADQKYTLTSLKSDHLDTLANAVVAARLLPAGEGANLVASKYIALKFKQAANSARRGQRVMAVVSGFFAGVSGISGVASFAQLALASQAPFYASSDPAQGIGAALLGAGFVLFAKALSQNGQARNLQAVLDNGDMNDLSLSKRGYARVNRAVQHRIGRIKAGHGPC